LSRIEDREQLKDEIATSKRRLEEELSKPALHFCYPNGKRGDFNEDTLKIVEQCGFQSAVTTEPGMNYKAAEPFLLRRLGTGPTDPPEYFQELLAGVRKE
jgi:peptidoglycan/xylan/chitin deacetylase (PgdA/CDA1 family)